MIGRQTPGVAQSGPSMSSYAKFDEQSLTELVRQAEQRLSAQLARMIAGFQRGIALAGILIAAAAAAFAYAKGQPVPEGFMGGGEHPGDLIGFGLAFASIASGLSALATRPALVGSSGRWWRELAVGPAPGRQTILAHTLERYEQKIDRNRFWTLLSDGLLFFSLTTAIWLSFVVQSSFPRRPQISPPYIEGARGERSPVSPLMCGKLFIVCDQRAWAEKARLERATPAERKIDEQRVQERWEKMMYGK